VTDAEGFAVEDAGRMLAEYQQTALEWDAAANNASKANRLFKQNHAIYKRLRESPEGREGIAELMTDPARGVQLLAATHSLAWRQVEAIRVLEFIAQSAGLQAVTARYTLKSYREGKLDLDW
jgi:Domain of unknown function (DUF2019)